MKKNSMIMTGGAVALLLAGTAAGSAYLATSSDCWTDRCREQQAADAVSDYQTARLQVRAAWEDVETALAQRVEIAKTLRSAGQRALAERDQTSRRELTQIAVVTDGLTDGELLSVGEPYIDRADSIRAAQGGRRATFTSAVAGLDRALSNLGSNGNAFPVPATAGSAERTVKLAAELGGAIAQAQVRLVRAGFSRGGAGDPLQTMKENNDNLCALIGNYNSAVAASATKEKELRTAGRPTLSLGFVPFPANACARIRSMPEPAATPAASPPRRAAERSPAPTMSTADAIEQRARLKAQAEIRAMQVRTKALNEYRDQMLQRIESIEASTARKQQEVEDARPE